MASIARRQDRGVSPNRRRRGLRWWEWIQLFVGGIIAVVLLGATGAALFLGHLLKDTADSLGSLDQLVEYRPGGITEIYSTDKDPSTGKPMVLGKVYGQYREYVPINKIPDVVKFATLAIEDERFYEHLGVDLQGIARAAYKNYKSGHMGEGASTLTQQLVRNLIPIGNKKTLDRKLKEALLSVQIERNFSKEQILEMYLNEVCYGANAFGIQAAARVYFNKSVDKLTLSEAAMLAGLPQRPTFYEPFKHYDSKKAAWTDEEVFDRRNLVLAKMLEVKSLDAQRKDHIIAHNLPKLEAVSAEAVEKAKKDKPKLAAEPDPENVQFRAPSFTNYVLRQLIQKFGKEKVYNGGLKVYTTLNLEMQAAAVKTLTQGVKEGKGTGVTEGALVCVEPKTGYIRAMVGSVDPNQKFNNVVQGKRQPGSSFKVFVYTAAFSTGRFGPDSEVNDSPVSFGKWSPKNYGGGYHGSVSIRQAFMHSYNVPAVKIANEVGIDRVLETAKKMGVDTTVMEKQRNLALALGAGDVTPLEMASAYSTFPNQGDHADPMAIIRVVDSEGNEMPGFEPHVDKAVVQPSVVGQMSEMMRDVVTRGTAASAAGIQEVVEAHGKTGTTNDNRDAWFVGYTPELSAAVWVCGMKKVPLSKKNPRLVTRYVPMEGVTGGHVCAPIWASFMKAAVPIQQRYIDANRVAPEQVIPKNAAISAGLNGAKPTSTPTPSGIVPAEPAPKPAPTPDGIVIPRSDKTKADGAEPDGKTDTTEKPLTDNNGDRSGTGTVSSTNGEQGPAGNVTAESAAPVVSDAALVRTNRGAINGIRTTRAGKQAETLEICPESGRRATKWCPAGVSRSYPAGQAPRGYCTIHKPMPGDG